MFVRRIKFVTFRVPCAHGAGTPVRFTATVLTGREIEYDDIEIRSLDVPLVASGDCAEGDG